MIETKEIQLFKKVTDFVKATHRLTWEEFKGTPFSPEQPILLFAISKLGPINQKDLAKYLMIKPATLTLRLQKLEKSGYIERSVDQNDKRNQYVRIAKEGDKITKQGYLLLNKIGIEIFECLNQEELNQLDIILSKLIVNVEDKRKEKKETNSLLDKEVL